MTLVTGSPFGTIETAEELYLDGAPYLYFQDYDQPEMYAPDSDGFYWGLTGSAARPIYEMGCLTAVSLTENLTINDVLCDNIGVKSTVQQRNYVEFQFTVQSFFPLQTLTHILKGGTVTENTVEHTQKFGLGPINNNQYWHVYAPKVYDQDVGDYVVIQLHKAQFVNAFTINMSFGTPWQIQGVVFRAMADGTKPSSQSFATILRVDSSVIV